MYKLDVENLSRNFGPRKVLVDISFSLSTGDSMAIIGNNGSGKTTLLRILAGLTTASRGEITFSVDGEKIDRRKTKSLLSYVGPELTLYDSLTAAENLKFFATMRGMAADKNHVEETLDAVGLKGRGGDLYRAYSSGMKQRLKYAVALLNNPAWLLLDEPSSNLDEAGKQIVSEIIARQKDRGILIMATNEKEEYGFAENQYRLGG